MGKKTEEGYKVNFNDFIEPPCGTSQEAEDASQDDEDSQDDDASQDDASLEDASQNDASQNDASQEDENLSDNLYDLTLDNKDATSVRSSDAKSSSDASGSIWDHRHCNINEEVMTVLYKSSEEEN
eukprot:scaffold154548_cov29-Attheya_sp.AAC.1